MIIRIENHDRTIVNVIEIIDFCLIRRVNNVNIITINKSRETISLECGHEILVMDHGVTVFRYTHNVKEN